MALRTKVIPSSRSTLRLNCDLGESFGSWQMGLDEHAMPFIDQANIACGFHAGDFTTMRRTVLLMWRCVKSARPIVM
jgi:UPF0271 protein